MARPATPLEIERADLLARRTKATASREVAERRAKETRDRVEFFEGRLKAEREELGRHEKDLQDAESELAIVRVRLAEIGEAL